MTLPTNCQSNTYANNHTHLCVSATNCPVGTFADSDSRYCVYVCPNITNVPWFGDSTSRTCTRSCTTGYGDGGINLCVSVCFTVGTFGDPNNGNTCQASCTQPAGQTWYADDYSRTCVQRCPYPGKDGACSGCPIYFADPTTFTCLTTCPNNYFASSSGSDY